jgi:hypothetical protein
MLVCPILCFTLLQRMYAIYVIIYSKEGEIYHLCDEMWACLVPVCVLN